MLSSVEAAERAMAEKNLAAAAGAIANVSQIGTLGQLESFSDLAIRADEIARRIIEQVENEIASAKSKLEDTQSGFDGVLMLTAIEEAYVDLPQLRKAARDALRDVKKNKTLRGEVKPAEAIVRARKLASDEKTRRRAEVAYQTIMSRYANSPAGQIARRELAQLNPDFAESRDGGKVPAQDGQPEMREWTDRTGRYTMLAKFVELKSGNVYLEKSDGRVVLVPIGRLSEVDRHRVQSRE